MLILILLFYVLPVYLVFYHFKWIPLTRFWKIVLPLPPVVALIFLWYALGLYAPISQNAYVQAPVVQVSSQVAGVVNEVLVGDNVEVKAGDPLFRIDPAPFQFRVDQARAKLIEAKEQAFGMLANVYAADESVNRAEANLELAHRNQAISEADVLAASASVAKITAQVEFAQAEMNRMADLVAANAVSKEEYESSLRNLAVQQAELVESRQRENRAKLGVESSAVQISSAEAALREAAAQRVKMIAVVDPVQALQQAVSAQQVKLDQAIQNNSEGADDPKNEKLQKSTVELARFQAYLQEAQETAPVLQGRLATTVQAEEALKQALFELEQTLVRAPCDGVASNFQLTPGTYASPAKPVATIINNSSWRLVVPLPENWLSRVKPGDNATVALRGYPLGFREGKVQFIGRGVISGQGVPSGTLSDPQPTVMRQTDTPEMSQGFQVIIDLRDDIEDQPLRVGATGRAVIFADGGMVGVNQVATLILTITSFMDHFFPKPSLTSLLVIAALVLSLVALMRFIRLPLGETKL